MISFSVHGLLATLAISLVGRWTSFLQHHILCRCLVLVAPSLISMYFVKHLGWASITHNGRGLSCGAGQGRFLTKTSLWSDVYQNQACDRQAFQIILPGLLLFHAPGEEILHACILIRTRFEFFSLYLPPHHRRTVRVVHIHSCFMLQHRWTVGSCLYKLYNTNTPNMWLLLLLLYASVFRIQLLYPWPSLSCGMQLCRQYILQVILRCP